MGIFSKYFDLVATFPDYTDFVDKLVVYFQVDRIFSELAVWALIGICISVYASTPIHAARYTFLFFLGVNLGYFTYTSAYCGFDAPWSYIAFWLMFTCLTAPLGFACWYARSNKWLNVLIVIVMLIFWLAISFDGFSPKDFINVAILVFTVVLLAIRWFSRKKATV
jgi:hypothetical protein